MDAQDHLRNLKSMVVESIPNLHQYSIPWSPNGIDPSIPEHQEYLKKFCETFRRSMKAMIDKSLEARSKAETNQTTAQLYEEMLHHSIFCANKCR